jgi:hypothetical protein
MLDDRRHWFAIKISSMNLPRSARRYLLHSQFSSFDQSFDCLVTHATVLGCLRER